MGFQVKVGRNERTRARQRTLRNKGIHEEYNIEIGERARTSAFHHVHELCAFGWWFHSRIFAGFDSVETFFPSPENMYKVIVLHASCKTHTHTHSIHIYIHTYTHLLKFITESVHTRSFSFPLRFVSNKRWGNKKEKKKKRCFAKFPKKKLKWRNDEFNIFVTNSRYTTNSSYWLCAGTIARKKEKRESSNWALDCNHVCNTYTQITHTHT